MMKEGWQTGLGLFPKSFFQVSLTCLALSLQPPYTLLRTGSPDLRLAPCLTIPGQATCWWPARQHSLAGRIQLVGELFPEQGRLCTNSNHKNTQIASSCQFR